MDKNTPTNNNELQQFNTEPYSDKLPPSQQSLPGKDSSPIFEQTNLEPSQPITPHKKLTKPLLMFIALVVLLVAFGSTLLYYYSIKSQEPLATIPAETPVSDTTQPSIVFDRNFAPYKEVPVSFSPQVPVYSVEPDFSNVANIDDFEFTEEEKAKLIANGFFVKKGYNSEFYPLYEANRYQNLPSFVTTDSMLHNYHLMFGHLLKRVETEQLIPELKKLSSLMLQESLEQEEQLRTTEWGNAALRNVAFFAVGGKLLDESFEVPAVVQDVVSKELTKISQKAGISDSAVMNIGTSSGDGVTLDGLKEDYTQYSPRGHYTKSEELSRYFNAMMWYGRISFRMKSEDEIKSAVLITQALNQGNNKVVWNTIFEPVSFFVGKSDDITYYEFSDLTQAVYGENPSLADLHSDNEKFVTFVEKARYMTPPQINSMPIFNEEIQPDRDAEITAYRFMGQRFTLDAAIFQKLVDRDVPGRMLPKALDITAAMGSDEALAILTELEETKYPNYSENMAKMRSYVNSLERDVWTQNLYWGWLYSLEPLTRVRGTGYPFFMKSNAWLRKDLNTYLGSWTELKHDTVLYAKQVYAELGGGGDIDIRDTRGYVEPNPYLYARLAGLIRMTIDGLQVRNLVTDDMVTNLERMEKLSLALKTISEKQLNNQNLTNDEYELIKSYGGQLEHFWMEVNKEEMESQGLSPMTYLFQNPAAVVTDVATDPNGQVLQEAIGSVFDIFVVVPVEGELKIAKGGVFSYYEFPWPMADRLTNEKWRAMLGQDDIMPKLPMWTSTFIVE